MGEAGIAHRLIDLVGNAASFPVMRATAISPVSSGSAALMRAMTLARSASIRAQAVKSYGGDFASGAEAGEPGLARESKPPGSTGSGSGGSVACSETA